MTPQVQAQMFAQSIGYNCSKCECNIFQSKLMIRKISRFVTGTDNDAMIPIDIIICDSCGEIAKDLLPKEYRDILFNNVSDT